MELLLLLVGLLLLQLEMLMLLQELLLGLGVDLEQAGDVGSSLGDVPLCTVKALHGRWFVCWLHVSGQIVLSGPGQTRRPSCVSNHCLL